MAGLVVTDTQPVVPYVSSDIVQRFDGISKANTSKWKVNMGPIINFLPTGWLFPGFGPMPALHGKVFPIKWRHESAQCPRDVTWWEKPVLHGVKPVFYAACTLDQNPGIANLVILETLLFALSDGLVVLLPFEPLVSTIPRGSIEGACLASPHKRFWTRLDSCW